MAEQNIMQLFKAVVLVQLFYAVAITMYTHSLPADTQDFLTSFAEITKSVNLTSVTNEISSSVGQQTNLPLIELGALIFYSGNILLDLILNFFFAIPQMITLVITGLTRIFSIDVQFIYIVQIFASAAVGALYFISIIQLLTTMRSGRVI